VTIDEGLLEEAQRIGGQRTKKETVSEALREYVQCRKQAKIRQLFGTVEFDSKYKLQEAAPQVVNLKRHRQFATTVSGDGSASPPLAMTRPSAARS
jgi:hypothetical protein